VANITYGQDEAAAVKELIAT